MVRTGVTRVQTGYQGNTSPSAPETTGKKKKFFLEDTVYSDKPAIAPPGEKLMFAMRPLISCWTPDALTILAFSKNGERLQGSTAVTDRGAGLEHPVCLREIHLGGHVVTFDEKDNATHRMGGIGFTPGQEGRGGVPLAGKNIRTLQVAEVMYCVVENTSKKPVLVKLAYEGHSNDDSRPYPLAPDPRPCSKTRRFGVPPTPEEHIIWRSPWHMRTRRLWIHSDSRGDLDLLAVKIGNRDQLISEMPIAVEAFENGLAIVFDACVVAQDFDFVMRNTSDSMRHMEIEMEADVDDVPAVDTTRKTSSGYR